MAQRHLVGLDIGSKFIKAVQLTQSAGQYKVTEFVNELFSKKNFKTKRVASAVSGRFVFVRYISMPVMSDEELVNAAKYELGKYIPVEVDEVLHDSQKLEELAAQEGQEPEMRVLLVAAKRTFIDEHVGILEGAGLQPAIVDVDSFALGNAYELSGMINPQAIAAGKLVALVDIGASKTNINIMSDSISYFTREFYKGGDDLTDSISKKLSLEVKDAEAMKRGVAGAAYSGGGGGGSIDTPSNPGNMPIVMVSSEDADKLRGETGRRGTTRVGSMGGGVGGGGGDADRVVDCISSVVEDICHDINISIDYFENQYDKKVEEVYITGGASSTIGLPETLERTVQKPVNRWNPLQYFELELPRDSQQELQDNPTQAAIALGLAARIVE
ncbi:MAG: type IV pilus assembly protein PilM [Planctomycetes bacterium]|nr:type IV pilus assembly protein PilM [Planctomycetota bacterium]